MLHSGGDILTLDFYKMTENRTFRLAILMTYLTFSVTIASGRTQQSAASHAKSSQGSATTNKSYQLTIDATKQWVDTNIDVRGGEKLRATTTGTVTYPPAGKNPDERSFGPDGLTRGWADLIHEYAVPDGNHGE